MNYLFSKLISSWVRAGIRYIIDMLSIIPGSSRTGSSGFFVGVCLGKIYQSPNLVLMKPMKDMNSMSSRRDITEMLLKAA